MINKQALAVLSTRVLKNTLVHLYPRLAEARMREEHDRAELIARHIRHIKTQLEHRKK